MDRIDWGVENEMQVQVREFMMSKYQERGSSERALSPEGKLLRFRLVHEEAGELCSAIMKGDEVEVVDGICDLLYVTFGAAEAYGINIKPFFDEVHRTNMLKVPEHQDTFGKVLKGPLWEKPKIAELLTQLTVDGAMAQLNDDPSEWEIDAMPEALLEETDGN